MSHNGYGNNSTMFWDYKISDYNLWERVGETSYTQALFLGDIIKNNVNFLYLQIRKKKSGRH
jgi:hypothetical protein